MTKEITAAPPRFLAILAMTFRGLKPAPTNGSSTQHMIVHIQYNKTAVCTDGCNLWITSIDTLDTVLTMIETPLPAHIH